MLFILAQLCGIITLVLTVIAIQFKSKEKIVICNIFANAFASIQYLLLGASTGAVISILNTIRDMVFYIFKKKEIKPSFIVLIIFLAIALISGFISWQNIYSIIPIIVTIIYTYGLWQDNIKVIRISTVIIGFGWAIYDVVVKAYVGALQVTCQCLLALIALYINRSNIKNNKNV